MMIARGSSAVTPVPPTVVSSEKQETSLPPADKDPFNNSMFDEDKYSALAVIDDASKEVTSSTDCMDILTNTLDPSVSDIKVLTPQLNLAESFEVSDVDPFDTSFADIRPGEAEIKIIESELIS